MYKEKKKLTCILIVTELIAILDPFPDITFKSFCKISRVVRSVKRENYINSFERIQVITSLTFKQIVSVRKLS